jgi:hypothetical protein
LLGFELGQRRAEIPECPLLGERSRLEEDDRDLRVAASGGQPFSIRAQNTRLVRGHVSRTLRIRPPSMGSRTRYGSRESGSGFRATTKFTLKA